MNTFEHDYNPTMYQYRPICLFQILLNLSSAVSYQIAAKEASCIMENFAIASLDGRVKHRDIPGFFPTTSHGPNARERSNQ